MKKNQKKLVEAHLVLMDGTIFTGEMVGAAPEGGIVSGEVVFNTVFNLVAIGFLAILLSNIFFAT